MLTKSRGKPGTVRIQAAWNAIRGGQHAVVVTPTASGKTLYYNLPVLQAAMNERAKALYLFPTKALAQDQVAELLELNTAGRLAVRAFTFDGDTPGDARQAVRTRGDIVVSNPDVRAFFAADLESGGQHVLVPTSGHWNSR